MTFNFTEPARLTISEANNHCVYTFEKLRIQREQGRFCDMVLSIQGRTFHAHRCVLASCSPWFNSRLKMHKTTREHLEITNCKNYEIFHQLLTYCYTGQIIIDKNNVPELLQLSHYFVISKLKAYCAEYLKNNLNQRNWCFIIEMATKYSLSDVMKHSFNFLESNFAHFINRSELLQLSLNVITIFLDERAWNLCQDSLLRFISSWISYDLTLRKEHFLTLLQYVNWPNVNSAFLNDHLEKDPLYYNSPDALFCILNTLNRNGTYLEPKYHDIYLNLQDRPLGDQEFEHELNDSTSFLSMAINSAVKDLEHSEVDPEWFFGTDPTETTSSATDNYYPPTRTDRPVLNRAISTNSDFDFNSVETEYQIVEQVINEQRINEERYKYKGIQAPVKRFDPKFRALTEAFRQTEDLHQDKSTSESKDGNEVVSTVTADKFFKYSNDLIERNIKKEEYDLNQREKNSGLLLDTHDDKYDKYLNVNAVNKNARIRNSELNEEIRSNSTQIFDVDKENEKGFKVPVIDMIQKNLSFSESSKASSSSTIIQTLTSLSQIENSFHQSYLEMSKNCEENKDSSERKAKAELNITEQEENEQDDDEEDDYEMDERGLGLQKTTSEHVKKAKLLKEHLKSEEEKLSESSFCIQCPQCAFKTKFKSQMTKHFKTHSSTSEYECPFCSSTCHGSKKELRAHIISYHVTGPPFTCDSCPYSNSKLHVLLEHRGIHGAKNFSCSHCSYTTHSKRSLRAHGCSSGLSSFTCTICQKSLLTKKALKSHQLVHNESISFKCDVCNFQTKYRNHLSQHKRIHGGFVLKCNLCLYVTTRKALLEAHIRAHLGDKKFKCQICEKGFVEKSHLTRHSKIHSGEKPFVCSVCPFKSNRKDKLKQHLTKSHHEPVLSSKK